MLTASILGLNYCRLLTETLSALEAGALTSEFDYTFAVCYDTCKAPGFETIQKNACLIDLSNGLDHAFSKFNATSRTDVRRSEKTETLTFRVGIGVEFSAYFNFYKTCEMARGWFPVPEEELCNSLIITAFFNSQPISGMSAYTHDGRMRIGRIFSLKNKPNDTLLTKQIFGCAAKRIIFEFCQYGVQHDYHTLDLSGIDLHDPSKAGITQFKLSLGGKVSPVTIARHANAKFKALASQIREAGYDIT